MRSAPFLVASPPGVPGKKGLRSLFIVPWVNAPTVGCAELAAGQQAAGAPGTLAAAAVAATGARGRAAGGAARGGGARRPSDHDGGPGSWRTPASRSTDGCSGTFNSGHSLKDITKDMMDMSDMEAGGCLREPACPEPSRPDNGPTRTAYSLERQWPDLLQQGHVPQGY